MYNHSSSKKKKSKKNITKSKWIKPFWICYCVIILFIALIFTFINFGWFGFMPSFAELENPKSNLATEIYSEDGVLLGKYYIENRSPCKYEELSPSLVNALIAT